MTPPRRRAPGRGPHGSPGRQLLLLLMAALLVAVAACGSSDTSEGPPGSTASPGASASSSDGATTTEPTAGTPGVTPEPTDPGGDGTSPPPSEEPTENPSSDASGTPGTGAVCTGNAQNQAFFASVAAAVTWPVYCPSLPAGWFVATGQYHLAGGGQMIIGYKGPGGAKLTLSEGAFCQDANGCVPAGHELGGATFGDLDGTLSATDDGAWAIVVAQGQNPSWLLVASVASEAAARALGDSLVIVGD